MQQILDAFNPNCIFDPWDTLPIIGGRLWSAKNGVCRRRGGTGDWVGWGEKFKNANPGRMQNKYHVASIKYEVVSIRLQVSGSKD